MAVSDARVTILGQPGTWLTDRFGHFTIPRVKPGLIVLRVEHLGFRPVQDTFRVEEGMAYHADVRISVRPIELEGLEVVVRSKPQWTWQSQRLAYRRMEQGHFGRFMTEDDFAARGHPMVKDMLWGINFHGGFGTAIYVDGVKTGYDFLQMSTQDVAILEIYTRPAGIPVQFRDPGTSSAILIWTR